jgi:hypothetical protein
MSNIAIQPGGAPGPTMPENNDVPKPAVLLAIQVGGGLLALLPIMSLNQFAKPPATLYWLLTGGALTNVVVSGIILIGFVVESQHLRKVIDRIGEIGICRTLIVYDILMLGGLVCLTGGSEKSAFAPQFAAVLPMAVLIKDTPGYKWGYAVGFLFMYLLGLQIGDAFLTSTDNQIKERWTLVFFFIFTLFPVIYSIQSERTEPAATNTANVTNAASSGPGGPATPGSASGEPPRKPLENAPLSSEGGSD